MDPAQILKSTQEQAVAAWVHHLNQMRLDELVAKLAAQDINLENALAELQKMKVNIGELLLSNRGGAKGIHGFLAEAAEVGTVNARNLVKGAQAVYTWINDNGPADLMRNGIEIQQKFVQGGGHFGLEHIREHLGKYPDFLKNGGKYQIPKDFYASMQKLLSLSEKEAASGPSNTYRLWKWTQDFFGQSGIKPSDIEPSVHDYSSVQAGKIPETIREETRNIKSIDQEQRNIAYEESKPSWNEAGHVAAVSAVAEGGIKFCLGVAKKRKEGKRLHDFTAADWTEVGIDTTKGAASGAIRGGTVYAMTNFTATPAAVANAFVSAVFGVTAQACQLRQGKISTEDFIANSEVLCLDASVSALASLLGQIAIPVPVLGAVIGNTVGMIFYGIVKDNLSYQEQEAIAEYKDQLARLNKNLDARYQQLLQQLREEFEKYTSVLVLAFDPQVNKAFEGSIALAEYLGVSDRRILRTKTEIDHYFMS